MRIPCSLLRLSLFANADILLTNVDITLHQCGIHVQYCGYHSSLMRISMFPTAEINVHRCVYLCLLRISVFPTASINVQRCGYLCLLRISMFPTADINVHRCVYLCLLRISEFPTASINVQRCRYLCSLRISMFPTADNNVNRCGYLCSQLRISLFNYCGYIFLNRWMLVQILDPNVDFLNYVTLIFIRFSKTMVRLQACRTRHRGLLLTSANTVLLLPQLQRFSYWL